MIIKEYKSYIDNNNILEIGDYIIVNVDFNEIKFFPGAIEKIINNSIGRIISIDDSDFPITAEFLDTDKPIIEDFSLDEIIYWSKDKEELEMLISTNKYNL